MKYASVCDGIGAAHVAWQPLGWQCMWTSEIDPFPSAVVEQRWGFENRGDMTKHKEWTVDEGSSIDLLVGGTPCQSFSVAGLRQGLKDPRGNLMLTYLAIAERLKPRWLVWENVPGVLSSNGGRDFGSFLGALGDLGFGWAYRVLDAQWFGVAQRRRRVFVVGCFGDAASSAKVLFESESVQRNPTPCRQKGQGTTHDVAPCIGASGEPTEQDPVVAVQDTCGTLCADHHPGAYSGQDAYTGRLIAQPIAFAQNTRDEVRLVGGDGSIVGALAAQPGMKQTTYVAFKESQSGCRVGDVHATLDANNGSRRMQGVMKQTSYIAFNTWGGTKRKDRPDGGFYARAESTTKTLDASGGLNPACSNGGTMIVNTAVGALAAQPGMKQTSYVAFTAKGSGADAGALCPTIRAGGHSKSHANGGVMPAVAHTLKGRGFDGSEDGTGRGTPLVPVAMAVRRLTPRECERLQGFPDDYTAITYRNKPAADGPRYKSLGNSMAVPCMRWIGERIEAADRECVPK